MTWERRFYIIWASAASSAAFVGVIAMALHAPPWPGMALIFAFVGVRATLACSPHRDEER